MNEKNIPILSWYQSEGPRIFALTMNTFYPKKKTKQNWFETMVEPNDMVEHSRNDTNSILENLIARMTQVLPQSQTQNYTTNYDSSITQVGWLQLCFMVPSYWDVYIFEKNKLGYINGDFPQPPSIDPTF